MYKSSLQSVAFVERAAWLSRELTRMKARGPGDTENVMRSIERDYGIDFWIVWRLRYALARIKDIPAHVYARIEAAYAAECERQGRRLAHELAIARKIAPSALSPEDLVDDADATPRVQPFMGEETEDR